MCLHLQNPHFSVPDLVLSFLHRPRINASDNTTLLSILLSITVPNHSTLYRRFHHVPLQPQTIRSSTLTHKYLRKLVVNGSTKNRR